jgi:hypothetical protein
MNVAVSLDFEFIMNDEVEVKEPSLPSFPSLPSREKNERRAT